MLAYHNGVMGNGGFLRNGALPKLVSNRPRPRCPDCDRAMEPVFTKRERGKTHERVKEVFWCRLCGMVARGRAKPKFV